MFTVLFEVSKQKKKKVQSVNKLIPMELQNGDERNDGRFEEYTYIEFLYRLYQE